MPALNKDTLTQKLQNLNSSQASIEGLSAWCMFYRKEAGKVVSVWEKEFMAAPSGQKQSMLYVANHLMQESRKRGREFIDEFFKVMPKSIRAAYKSNDEKLKKSVSRLLDVWDERRVFGSAHIKTFREIVNGERPHGGVKEHRPKQGSPDTQKYPMLHPLIEALKYVDAASQRASEAMNKNLKGIREGIVADGTAEELEVGVQLLVQYSSALEHEIAGRKHVVNQLRNLIEQQEDSISRSDDNLHMLGIQKSNIEKRLALIRGAGTMGPMHSAMSADSGMGLPPLHPTPLGGPGPMRHMGFGGPPPGPGLGGGGMGLEGAYGYQPESLGAPGPRETPQPPIGSMRSPPLSAPSSTPPNGTLNPGLHSPAAPAADSPMPPPMSPVDDAGPPSTPPFPSPPPTSNPPPAAPTPAPAPAAGEAIGGLPDGVPDLNPEALAELASKLIANDAATSIFAEAMAKLPQDTMQQVQQVLGGAPEDDDAPYDPENPF